MSEGYWTKVFGKRISRRHALAVTGSSAAAAAFLAACGGNDNNGGSSSGGGGGGGTTGGTGAALDPTKGNQGGKLIWQGYGDPGAGLELIKVGNAGVYQMASLTHDSLLEFAYGTPKYPAIGNEVLPNLATALPEISPDKLTATFKLRKATFHNGQPLTSEDVKWTYDTLAFASESAYKGNYSWLDSTQAPDPTTFVMKAKLVNADLVQAIAFKNHGAILNQAFQESAESKNSLMGSGPYKFVSYSPPSEIVYTRNPNYEVKPYPYFNDIVRLGTSDPEKKVADIISGQTHLTYWFPPEERDRILSQRKDLQVFKYPEAGCGTLYMRNDVAPFNDVRVRQALSMGYDRKPLINAVTGGEGNPDQALSASGVAWGFRKPADLKRKDLFELNLTEAKKLLSAAGITSMPKFTVPGWNATVIGQKWVDQITLIITQLRTNGLFDLTYKEQTFGENAPVIFAGQYDNIQWGPNTTATLPDAGIQIYNKYFSQPTGDLPPTNENHVRNADISSLVSKQLQEFDATARKAIFHDLEDLLAEEMVQASGV
ncbi:MAG TPA: ABC transporter substrate-binding protein, partial [Dehalococcoidia bacterium]|nr:ABC transporter substrate-binding protein [Dehalococcoidia bacterium]